MLDYYKNKRRLGSLTGLSGFQIVELMIDGLPPYLASAFVAFHPSSMDQFYEIANKAEVNLRSREYSARHNNSPKNVPRPQSLFVPKRSKPLQHAGSVRIKA